MKPFLMVALALLNGLLGAKAFEGKVAYRIMSLDGKNSIMMEFTLKDGLVRQDMKHKKGRTSATIMDPFRKTSIFLYPERKKYAEHSFEPGTGVTSGPGAPKVTKTGKIETIAGHKAEEWLFENKEASVHLWGTTELGRGLTQAVLSGPGELSGWYLPTEDFFILKLVREDKLRMGKIEAVSVKPCKVDAALFGIPAEYEKF